MSHHGNEFDPSRLLNQKLLHEEMKKLMGEYPNGKLTKDDAGAIAVAIGHENGAVILQFPKPVAWIGFTPDQAMEIAQTLMEHARAVGLTKPFTLKV